MISGLVMRPDMCVIHSFSRFSDSGGFAHRFNTAIVWEIDTISRCDTAAGRLLEVVSYEYLKDFHKQATKRLTRF